MLSWKAHVERGNLDKLPHELGRLHQMADTWRILETSSRWTSDISIESLNFQELMAGVKTFAEVEMKHLTSNDLFGPIKAFHQVTGAGNMAIAAQIPIDTNPARVNHDEHCLYVFIIQGIDQRCTLIEKCQSNDLAAQWVNR